MFVLTFISIMPILFGFLIAFTSYNGNVADVGLFDWVGFKNFVLIFLIVGSIAAWNYSRTRAFKED